MDRCNISKLDSIEYSKQRFKQENNLVDLSINSNISLQKSHFTEESIFTNENQIFITNSLIEELTNLNLELLPSNIGISNPEINNLIAHYNEKILEYKKLTPITNTSPSGLNVMPEPTRIFDLAVIIPTESTLVTSS